MIGSDELLSILQRIEKRLDVLQKWVRYMAINQANLSAALVALSDAVHTKASEIDKQVSELVKAHDADDQKAFDDAAAAVQRLTEEVRGTVQQASSQIPATPTT